ncbi:MAG: hypothetical protein HFJ30_01480 [Clostridia bacterium]|jgi:MinD-like ATPase involved in chromosome partitioning or flagellar assembly|nr:hypothetical protein [Clostridia bacterium]MCI9413213.1 hypothetical protein [Clostridia bacterium]
MAVVTFYSNDSKETGQSLSVAAIATHIAIAHNYKVLIISTSFNELTLENCFWEYSKIRQTSAVKDNNGPSIGLESGVEGLLKVLASNRTSNEIVKNYSRIVLKDRLDVLLAPATTSYQEYMQITPNYINIIKTADRYYDLVIVDLSKKMPKKDIQSILEMSDIIMVNLIQRLETINNFIRLREANDFYKKRNVMLALGRYDGFSKYNNKNITRYMKEKKEFSVVPYNTLFFEACTEGNIIDFFLRLRNIVDETDKNVTFEKAVAEADSNIIYKLQELQMKL